jgi:hypothetical protein
MSSVPIPESDVPTPFFTDSRTLAEKLRGDKRDWIPTKNADDPKIIFGLVLERGSYVGKNDTHPTARILDAGNNIDWGVIAFHGWLHSEFERKNPRVGDFVAIAYNGTRPAKKAGDSDAFMYAMEVERNPELPLDLEPAGLAPVDDAGSESPLPADDASESVPGDGEPAGADDDIPFE